MSTAKLHAAATVLRERADAATPPPWRNSSTEAGTRYAALVAPQAHPNRPNPNRGGWAYDEAYGGCLVGESLMGKDRAYIATVHPGIGLALADWLDREATDTDALKIPCQGHAVILADLILGGDYQ